LAQKGYELGRKNEALRKDTPGDSEGWKKKWSEKKRGVTQEEKLLPDPFWGRAKTGFHDRRFFLRTSAKIRSASKKLWVRWKVRDFSSNASSVYPRFEGRNSVNQRGVVSPQKKREKEGEIPQREGEEGSVGERREEKTIQRK